jgi:SAM-dependent methyltransferase
MHHAAATWLRSVLVAAAPTRVVEIGARNINGSVRDLLPHPGPTSYVGVDIGAGPGVDVVADGATFVPTESPDVVVCAETLEHAPNAAAIVQNALAMVVPGGRVVITCAGPGRAPHSAQDGGPLREGEFYRNLASAEIVSWAPGAIVEAAVDRERIGDTYVVLRKRCDVLV